MTYGMTTQQVRADAERELARQYAMARELRPELHAEEWGEPEYESWQREYWTAERIVWLRNAFGDSQKEFAERAGIARATVSWWENRANGVSLSMIPRLMALEAEVRGR